MDDSVGLLIVAPVLAFGLWALSFFGAHAEGAGRAAVAVELAAAAAVDAAGSRGVAPRDAVEHAERVAVGAVLSACRDVEVSVEMFTGDGGVTAATDLECVVATPLPEAVRLCFTGFAPAGAAPTGHVRRQCPTPDEEQGS